MAAVKKTGTLQLPPPNPDTFSSRCQDQMLKVDSNIYHLDRLRSSLKSIYLHKLFTSGDFAQKNDLVLEFKPKNAEVFPCVVELIHGKKLIDVLTKDNYLPLLESLEHLKMEINVLTVSRFIDEKLKSLPPQEAKIFELYDFIRKRTKFEYLLTSVFNYLSNHLTDVLNHEVLPSILLDHLIGIIKPVQNMDDDKKYDIVQICARWLSHDYENRLPRMPTLVNSIKPVFQSKKENRTNYDRLSSRIFKSKTDERDKRNTIAGCVFAMLAFDKVPEPDPIYKRKNRSYGRGGFNRNLQRRESTILVNLNNEYNTLWKFLKNGDLYDITVRIGDKAYKLHRALLESKSGYFVDIFRAEYAEAMTKCDGAEPKCPGKDKEYSLDDADQATFEAVINYIYFNKGIEWKFDNAVRCVKTVDILKIEELVEYLTEWLKEYRDEIDSKNLLELLNYLKEKDQLEDLYLRYLCRYMSTMWSENDQETHFRSISCTALENMIKSSHLSLDDPYTILDFCSAWIAHDVRNRYRFLLRIARTVNPNCPVAEDEYSTGPPDLADCSRQFIREKLWEILSILPYNESTEELAKNGPNEVSKKAVFVALKDENIVVLNADLNEIASFDLMVGSQVELYQLRATIVGDNLFVLCSATDCSSDEQESELGVFRAYNFSSKKIFSLSFDFDYDCGALVNCNGEIYYGSPRGQILKFSMQLNRWIIISENQVESLFAFQYASDGENLYRTNRIVKKINVGYRARKSSSFIVETYDFEKKSWSALGSPMSEDENMPEQLAIVNERYLVTYTHWDIHLFDRESNEWRKCCEKKCPRLVVHCENETLLVCGNKLYNLSLSNGNLVLKKDLPEEYRVPEASLLVYKHNETIFAIHRPRIRAN